MSPATEPLSVARRGPTKGLTLVEMIVALAVSGLLVAAVLSQMVESVSLSLLTARTVEHSRSARELVFRLSEDARNAQVMVIFPAFDDRDEPCRDGESGNYLVLHEVDATATITQTVGYYLVAASNGGWMLHRHDSADGVLAAGVLPDPGSAGAHRRVTRAVSLPNASGLFRCVRDRAVNIRGEFGTIDGGSRRRTEFIQTTVATRS